jgi:putative transposase
MMRKMRVAAIRRRAETCRRHTQNAIHLYLLPEQRIDRPNPVWAADATYIPMARGFGDLVAVLEWYSCRMLSWRLSNNLSVDFCVEAAIANYDAPEIFNTEQGSQSTAARLSGQLQ